MSWPLAAIFALVTAGNLAMLYRWFVLKQHGTQVPLIGGWPALQPASCGRLTGCTVGGLSRCSLILDRFR
jgi:hypothetical protein